VVDPGVLLFLLAPDPPGDDPQRLVRELGPVSCYVSDPSGAGQRALDTSVARVRGLLMVRWHPSFFGPVPDAVNGTYAYRWDEQRPDGSWRLLATAYVEVDLAAAPTEPAGGDPTAGGDGSSAVGT
jgi:hypothetical protein